ncbi:hypothetical protein Btru_029669 [Bulinus truncatus]|nr:hypothetical protein Btru_029669 [Bulinus truncatus]
MDEWMDEWMSGWMSGWLDESMDEWMDTWMDECLDEWVPTDDVRMAPKWFRSLQVNTDDVSWLLSGLGHFRINLPVVYLALFPIGTALVLTIMTSLNQALACLVLLSGCAVCQRQNVDDVVDRLEQFAEENFPSETVELLNSLGIKEIVKQSLESADISQQETKTTPAGNRLVAYNSLQKKSRDTVSPFQLAAYKTIQKNLRLNRNDDDDELADASHANNRITAYKSIQKHLRKSGHVKTQDGVEDDDSQEAEVPLVDNRVFAYNTLPQKSGAQASQVKAGNSLKNNLHQELSDDSSEE